MRLDTMWTQSPGAKRSLRQGAPVPARFTVGPASRSELGLMFDGARENIEPRDVLSTERHWLETAGTFPISPYLTVLESGRCRG